MKRACSVFLSWRTAFTILITFKKIISRLHTSILVWFVFVWFLKMIHKRFCCNRWITAFESISNFASISWTNRVWYFLTKYFSIVNIVYCITHVHYLRLFAVFETFGFPVLLIVFILRIKLKQTITWSFILLLLMVKFSSSLNIDIAHNSSQTSSRISFWSKYFFYLFFINFSLLRCYGHINFSNNYVLKV